MTSTVSFKVYLTNDDDRHTIKEVRRFGIDKDVSESFLYFREKLQTVFSSLRGRHFTVYWKDDDNDDVVVSSDEELHIAMYGNDQAKAYKFYVTPHSDTPVVPPRNQVPQRDAGQNHPGIICDGCDNGIRGFRYKCIQCVDYDLCASCEAKGLHQEHCMIRIATPMQWKPQYSRRLVHHMNRFVRKAAACEAKEEAQKKCPYRSNRHPRSHHDPETPSWLETLLTYLNDWTNLPVDGHCSTTETPQKASQESKSNEGKKPEDNKKPLDPHDEFLKNLGASILQILDPLGIDVNVQVRNDDVPVASPASNQDEKIPQAQEAFGENIPKFPGEGRKLQENPEKESPAAKKSPVPSTDSEIVIEKPSLENEGWTVLNDLDGYPPVTAPTVPVNVPAPEPIIASNGQMATAPFSANAPHLIPVYNIPAPVTAPASASVSVSAPTPTPAPAPAPAPAPTSTPVTIPFYPALVASTPGASQNSGAIPKQVPAQGQPDNSVAQKSIYPQLPNKVTYHPDPKIQASVEAMVQMGFKNENGWLTDLLVAKNGDISKVLDVLQPVRR